MIQESINIYKYVDKSTFNTIIENQSLKFTYPQNFNDPFDSSVDRIEFKMVENLCALVKADLDEVTRIFGKQLKYFSEEDFEHYYKSSVIQKIEETAITCFSLDNLNQLMWAHYADKHQGVCLVFDLKLNESPFIDITYEKLNFGVVNYETSNKLNYLEDKYTTINTLLNSKSKDWEYESEFRISAMINEDCYRFNPEFLQGVIFGLKFPKEEIPHFISKCKQNGFEGLVYQKVERNGLEIELKNIV
jgi:hypothetical protein